VISLIGYAPDQKTFDDWAKTAEARFRELHKLFDAYHSYPGLENVATINAQAGIAPVKVSPEVLTLFTQVEQWRKQWSDKVNVTMGPVLKIWEKTRLTAETTKVKVQLPTASELTAALQLSQPDKLVIDEQAGTIYLAEKGMLLDVGAVAKGYATELVAQDMVKLGVTSMIVNAGGSNVRLIGKPQPADRLTWKIGIQNPEYILPNPVAPLGQAAETSAIVAANNTSVVTSGDYQRYFVQDGVIYHHILDPVTGQPIHYFRSVTIVTPDSGLADFLSTALFILPPAESRRLAESIPDVEVLWLMADGTQTSTAGFPFDGGK
jgi:thiamine biosynthesis lipoprotein